MKYFRELIFPITIVSMWGGGWGGDHGFPDLRFMLSSTFNLDCCLLLDQLVINGTQPIKVAAKYLQ